jgi:UDP-N-acetylglucosamine--N-acetylmuramyl-(pentapeptide) pyrophosphoryl-undecaprenol N-acetylglucosamine transferase
VGAGKELEQSILADQGYEMESIKAKAFRGQGVLGRFLSLAGLPGTLLEAKRLLEQYNPDMVLAVGGYAAFALGLASRIWGTPLAVQEQNALPGLTNRVLGKLAKMVFISFKEAQDYFPKGKCRLLGNPVRLDLLADGEEAAAQRPNTTNVFNVLVLGGSQGAQSINQALVQSLDELAPYKERLVFVHQTGRAQEAVVARAYEDKGYKAKVAGFFQNMGELYGRAHLVICRAGAGTLTELACLGRPSICVPYPHAAGDHQTKNAESMVRAGAARMIADSELSGPKVAGIIMEMIDNPQGLDEMARRAQELARPDAAMNIAGDCLELMKGRA